jgi:hypothetical protein
VDDTAVTNITCTDGAVEVLNTATASGSFTLADGQHAISCVASDGVNPAGAGSGSTVMPVLIDVDQIDPTLGPVVSPNPVELGGSGLATPNASDLPSGLASSGCGTVDTATVGVKSVACNAADIAGNSSAASVPYTVKYRFLGFTSPIRRSSYKRGAQIPVKFALANHAGVKLSDTAALALLSPTCRVKITLDGVEQGGCASYDTVSDTFKYDLKTSKGLAIGDHTIAIQVSAPDGSGVVNTDSVIVTIKT